MWRRAVWGLAAALTVATAAACAQAPSDAASAGLTRRCIESLAAMALTNPRNNDFAANIVGPLGLTPTSDPNAPPYRTKQVEFHFSDGTGHYFAVDGPAWTKATIMRAVATAGEPRVRFFVMDRDGAMLAAGVMENRKLRVADISDPAVKADFLTEQGMWRLAGADDSCGPG